MPKTPTYPKLSHPLRLADLPTKKPTRFELAPTPDVLSKIASDLGLIGLRKLRFVGTVQAEGRKDWVLHATIGATVVQPCGITLNPVTTRVDQNVVRRYLFEMPDPDSADDDETVLDETIEPLQDVIDVADVMVEELSLNLPLYPRSKDAELGEAIFTGPGEAPMRDEDTRPFANLKSLRDKLKNDDE